MIDRIIAHLENVEWVTAVHERESSLVVATNTGAPPLRVEQLDKLPAELPLILIDSSDDLRPETPHVSWDGQVCVTDRAVDSLDLDSAERVVEWYLHDAVQVITQTYADPAAEFYSEFEGYWNAQKTKPLIALGMLEEEWEVWEGLCSGGADALPTLAFRDERELRRSPGVASSQRGSQQRVKVHALRMERPILAPLPRQELTGADVLRLLEGLRPEVLAEFKRHISAQAHRRRKSRRALNLLLYLPKRERLMGGAIALHVPQGYLLTAGVLRSCKTKPKPLRVLRHSPDYLHLRSGLRVDWSTTSVAVVGCGAVGGYLAETLAQTGFTSLTLIDSDVLEPDNILRHVLPETYLLKNKAAALKEFLDLSFPYLNVEAVPKDLGIGSLDSLADFDVVVDATGVTGISRSIVRARPAKHVLSVWLEPGGAGGHAVLSGDGRGCLECFYHLDGEPRLENRYRFVASGSEVAINLTGCAGAFFPFLGADAKRTALIGSDLLSRSMLSERTLAGGSRYAFWRGDAHELQMRGVETTDWFERCGQAWEEVDGMLLVGCPVCRRTPGDGL